MNPHFFFYRPIGLLLALLVVAAGASAQQAPARAVQTDKVVWLRYSFTYPFHPKWTFRQEVDERFFVFPGGQQLFMLRSQLSRQLSGGFTAGLGLANVGQQTRLPAPDPANLIRLEWRPHQEILHRQNLSPRVNLQNRLRLEQRFFQRQDVDGDYWGAGAGFSAMRLRYFISGNYAPVSWLSLQAYHELMLHAGPDVGPKPFSRHDMGLAAVLPLSKNP